jgi:hypothetical protein
MGRVESLQQQIQELSADELAELRDWLLELDWKLWVAHLQLDVHAGRLDALASQALRDHAAGKSNPV